MSVLSLWFIRLLTVIFLPLVATPALPERYDPPPVTPLPISPLPSGTTFRPTVLPLSANELANPGRGLYHWSGDVAISDRKLISSRDRYKRFRWDELEPKQGVYDFSEIDQLLADAERSKQRAIIGIVQPIGPAENGGTRMPDYLTNTKYGTWWSGTFWPDYNNPFVLARLEAIIQALGQRYNGDARLGLVQMIHYGAYGEYHVPYRYGDSVPRITDANAERTIAMFMKAFWNKRLVGMLTDNSQAVMTRAALRASPKIGWSRMSLGCAPQMETVGDILVKDDELGQLVRDRWKTAPIWTELIGTYKQEDCGDLFANTLQNVKDFHISAVGNGNFPAPYDVDPYTDDGKRNPASAWSDTQVAQIVEAGKRAGYRYWIPELKAGIPQPGKPWQLDVLWQNDGNAPIYEYWQVYFQLRTTNGITVWQQKGLADLRGVLPGGPVRLSEQFTLPANLARGEYNIHVMILPPGSAPEYLGPLQLAMNGRQSDGSYLLGALQVP